jgi:hypothetical protein
MIFWNSAWTRGIANVQGHVRGASLIAGADDDGSMQPALHLRLYKTRVVQQGRKVKLDIPLRRRSVADTLLFLQNLGDARWWRNTKH